MIYHYLFCAATFVVIFVLFLVLSRTLGIISNYLTKMEYLVQSTAEQEKSELNSVRLVLEKAKKVQQAKKEAEDRLIK